MKRIGNLFENIISISNLYEASKNASKGKNKRKDVKKWNNNLFNNILNLHDDLKNGNYKVSEYYLFKIREPKERLISKLPFRDRIVHHTIMLYLEPILKRIFITYTYSCIKNRGILKCSLDLRKFLRDRENSKFVLKLDISKFYPSIDHTIIKSILRKKFKDNKLLSLLDLIIDSCPGIPLGNYTSQWFANLYLNEFDHWLKEVKKVKYYLRYCDDLAILGENKRSLHDLRSEIEKYLSTKLNLKLSNYQVFPTSQGIDYVGYVHYTTHTLLRKSIKRRFIKMIKKNKNRKSIASYNGWISYCNGINLWNKYVNYGYQTLTS